MGGRCIPIRNMKFTECVFRRYGAAQVAASVEFFRLNCLNIEIILEKLF